MEPRRRLGRIADMVSPGPGISPGAMPLLPTDAWAWSDEALVDISVPMALIDGTRAWLDHVAPVRDAADAARITAFLDEAARRLRARA